MARPLQVIPRPTADRLPSRRALLALAAVLAVLWFGVLGCRDLIPTDEGRYAEIPREMVASGDWITPRLDGFKYFEKPPLQYWATAAAYEVLGVGAWQSRLWAALTGFLTIGLTGWAVRLLYGARAGVFAAAVLASNAYWIALGHLDTLDMGVSAFLAGALFAFALAQRDDATARARHGWMLACWAAMGLAVMSKGLIGLAFPGATLVLYTLAARDGGIWRRLHPATGVPLLLAIALPWHLAVQARNPEFLDFYIVYQQFTRFLTPALERPGPWWYFVPVLLAGMLPWLVALPQAVGLALRREPGRRLQPGWLLLIWSTLVFLFFSASHSKLSSYILPMFPALAALVGVWCDRAAPGALRRPLLGLAALAALTAAGAGLLGRHVDRLADPGAWAAYGHWLQLAGLLGLAAALGAWRLETRGRRAAAVLVLAAGFLAALTVATQGHQELGRGFSTRTLVQRIGPWLRPGQPFYSVAYYDQTLPFYLRREVTVVAYRGELDFGIGQDPARWVPTLQDFARDWHPAEHPLAFMLAGDWPRVRALGLPMQVIASTPRYVVVAAPAAGPSAPSTVAPTAAPTPAAPPVTTAPPPSRP